MTDMKKSISKSHNSWLYLMLMCSLASTGSMAADSRIYTNTDYYVTRIQEKHDDYVKNGVDYSWHTDVHSVRPYNHLSRYNSIKKTRHQNECTTVNDIIVVTITFVFTTIMLCFVPLLTLMEQRASFDYLNPYYPSRPSIEQCGCCQTIEPLMRYESQKDNLVAEETLISKAATLILKATAALMVINVVVKLIKLSGITVYDIVDFLCLFSYKTLLFHMLAIIGTMEITMIIKRNISAMHLVIFASYCLVCYAIINKMHHLVTFFGLGSLLLSIAPLIHSHLNFNVLFAIYVFAIYLLFKKLRLLRSIRQGREQAMAESMAYALLSQERDRMERHRMGIERMEREALHEIERMEREALHERVPTFSQPFHVNHEEGWHLVADDDHFPEGQILL